MDSSTALWPSSLHDLSRLFLSKQSLRRRKEALQVLKLVINELLDLEVLVHRKQMRASVLQNLVLRIAHWGRPEHLASGLDLCRWARLGLCFWPGLAVAVPASFALLNEVTFPPHRQHAPIVERIQEDAILVEAVELESEEFSASRSTSEQLPAGAQALPCLIAVATLADPYLVR